MPSILGTGIAALDVINTVDAYPPENAEVRALAQQVSRGGNVANTLSVLAQLGHRCAWAGTAADDVWGGLILDDLRGRGVDTSACQVVAGARSPLSCVALSRTSGSRTIVHYRDLPELSFADFARVDLAGYDWLHFEGRNVEQTRRMLEHARARHPATPRSVEVEKPREGIERLFALADVLLFSRHYATARGFDTPGALLQAMSRQAPQAVSVCAWGEDGAGARDPQAGECASPAFPPPQVVDTLGAGDVFNAGVIHARLHGADTAQAVEAACRLAGRKCGQVGLDNLV